MQIQRAHSWDGRTASSYVKLEAHLLGQRVALGSWLQNQVFSHEAKPEGVFILRKKERQR